MGRRRLEIFWPVAKKGIDTLRPTGLYGYLNEAAVRTRAALRPDRLPEIRFAIYGQGRTGSRLLCDLLDSHPEITCDLEILAERARSPRGLIEAHARLCDTRAHGFKFKLYQLTDRHGVTDGAGFLRDLHDDGWQLLYLRRSNVVRHALSSIMRERTGVTHKFGQVKKRTSHRSKVHVEPDELRRWIEQKKRRTMEELEALGELPHLNINYDDDLLGEDAQRRTTDRIAEWLGLEPVPTKADIRPNTPRRLRDLVENVDELAEVFAGTEEAQFFED